MPKRSIIEMIDAERKRKTEIARLTVEQVFLLYRDGRLMLHESREAQAGMDADTVGAMLQAIQDFVKTSFTRDSPPPGPSSGDDWVKEIRYKDLNILVEYGPHIGLATVVTGPQTGVDALRGRMKDVIYQAEARHAPVLEKWDGDVGAVEAVRFLVKNLLREGM